MDGRTISHYKIISKLGEGGMGEVWEAHDTRLDRTVAIKLIPQHLSADPAARKRFVHEAKAASSIEHANICTIFEIDETPEGETFIVMPRYQGELLSDRIARGRMPLDEALHIVEDLAGSLAEAHDHDIIHRDVKPANIIIDPHGRPILLDFGLAKLTEHTRVTKTGTTVGTLAYMAPEQAAGKDVDGRADLFSLGVVLYELVTGVRPFSGDHDAAVLYSIAHEPAAPLASHDPGLPDALQRIADRTLAKDPDDRYASLRELKAAIADLRHVLQVETRSRHVGSHSGQSTRRWMLPAIALVVIVAVVVVWRFGPGNRGDVEAAEPALAVVDFLDLATPDDVTVSAGMTELVSIGMVENCPIRVVSSEYLYHLRRRLFGDARGAIAEDQALEIARQSGATLMLAGRIGALGESRFVSWRLVDTHTGESLGASREDGEEFTTIADRIIERTLPLIAEACNVEAQTHVSAVEGITTTSPAAYRHYVASLVARDQKRLDARVRELEAAVAIDSTFALAIFELAMAHFSAGGYQNDIRAREVAGRAWELRDRLGEKDRMRLEAYRAMVDENLGEARAVFERLIARWPDDPEIRRYYRDMLLFKWYFGEALQVSERLLELVPDDPAILSEYGNLMFLTGRFKEHLDIATIVVVRSKNASDWNVLGNAYLVNGLIDSANVAYHRALEIDHTYQEARRGLADAHACRGDLERAISLYEGLIDSVAMDEQVRSDWIADDAFWPGLALYYFEGGQFDRALSLLGTPDIEQHAHILRWWIRLGQPERALEGAQVLSRSESPRRRSNAIRYRAFVLVALDSLDAARPLVQQLYDLEPGRGGLVRNRADQISADIALAEGDYEAALEILARMKKAGTSAGGMFHVDYLETLAEAYRQAGRFDDAVATLKALLKSYGWHSMAYLHLGRIYQETGKTEAAREALGTFLDRWKNADEGLPQLQDARRRLAAL